MRSARWSVFLSGLLALYGCDDNPGTDGGTDPDTGMTEEDGGTDAGTLGPVTLYTPVDLDDDTLADQVVSILTGTMAEPRCRLCHALTRTQVRGWTDETTSALTCIGDLDPNQAADAQSILDCFPTGPGDLGLVTTAVGLEWFTRTFDVRYGADARPEQDTFAMLNSMPRAPGILLTQEEVDVVLSWVARGAPGLDARFDDGGGGSCTLGIGPEVAAHVTTMQTEGWETLNRDRGMTMFGCGAGETGTACLSSFPTPADRSYATDWPVAGSSLRILYEYSYDSSYWTRSSPDGRFVSHGGSGSGAGANVIDLERMAEIGAAALYDPGFFPDNSGFVLQGAGRGGAFCTMDLLTSAPTRIRFDEPECNVFGAVGLYQHVAAVDGGDYWTVFGQFVSDDGGQSRTLSPVAAEFDSGANTRFVPLINSGSGFTPGTRISVPTPFEGDAVISPSGRLVMSRTRGPTGQMDGYVLRQLNATPSGGTYDVTIPEIARYCVRGAKVSFSFDEQWVVTHRYVTDDDATELGFTGPSDPGFARYRTSGAANLYLLNLESGAFVRITNMAPGQYALFPHFRSDGWIYFIVRDNAGVDMEYVVASDAAIAG